MSTSTRVTLNHAVQVFYLSFVTYFLHILFLFCNLIDLRFPILLAVEIFTERLLDAVLFFCTHLIDDLLRDFEDFLAFVFFLFTERLLDATLFFCTRLIDDLLRDFEDFLDFNRFLLMLRFFEDTLFFCCRFIDICLTHRLFRDLDILFIKIFDPDFLDADLLFLAVLRLIVTRAFLVVRPILFLHFDEMGVFFTETLLHIFFFIIPRDFNLGTFDVLLHLLFKFLLTILL